MRISHGHHLAYCTNIHPAESWEETFRVLKTDVLAVRDKLANSRSTADNSQFAIGLRLSAQAASELVTGDQLSSFHSWLDRENCYVFTINGFPYGAFHGTRVKEKVYQPDWSTDERLTYTKQLFDIIAALSPQDSGGSVSTLPGSFKEFGADEHAIFARLQACATHIEELAERTGKDLHLGLEPEPLGHFENTAETLDFFERFLAWAPDKNLIKRRIGINYDTCHFALEFDDCRASLEALRNAGLRISKVHLSSALEFDPTTPSALEAIKPFDEPTYLHQVIIKEGGKLTRHKDLPEFLAKQPPEDSPLTTPALGRIHFHIPLYAEPAAPLGSTQKHAQEILAYREENPDFCTHYEIETYTWGVLPGELQTDLTSQIAQEYEWVLGQIKA